jgi:hypothetical protein
MGVLTSYRSRENSGVAQLQCGLVRGVQQFGIAASGSE